jgi:gamma-glutamyltranspeptidase/glutathione hydrolase
MVQNIASHIDGYRKWPENQRVYLHEDALPQAGEILVQQELGQTLRQLTLSTASDRNAEIKHARHAFYEGDIADQAVNYYRSLGSPIRKDDFSEYRAVHEPPISVTWKELTVWGCGPWSQGPVLLMALNILRNFDLEALEPLSPDLLHLIIESLKLAFVDLDAHCGDPRFVDVPIEALLDPSYGAARAELISMKQAIRGVPPFGDPRKGSATGGYLGQSQAAAPGRQEPDTSFVCAIDRFGNAFSATPSDGYSGNPLIPGLGIHLSSRGVQSRLEPEHPNVLAPRKRPRLTPNPVIVTRGGQPYMTLGTPGNNRQPQAMLQTFIYSEVFRMPPQQAVEMPRVASYSFPETSYPYSAQPNLVRAESNIPSDVLDTLRSLGHHLETVPALAWGMGGICIIRKDPDTGVMWSGADPRRETYAVAL